MADNNHTSGDPSSRKLPRLSRERKAAADLIEADIARIYDGKNAPLNEIVEELEQVAEQNSEPAPDQQSQTPENAAAHSATDAQWQNYHTSWQSYYQQYYERYYLNHVHRIKNQPAATNPTDAKAVIGSHPAKETQEETATNQLREQLLGTVKERADTVRGSRHFAPVATAMVFALLFLFLQYNRFLTATVQAYVSPGSIDPQNIIVDPNASLKVGPEPKLIIPKINVEPPVVYGVDSSDEPTIQNNLRSGVVHYPIPGASSAPGQNGATVILGHSSNDVFDSGAYKFVFVQLSKLEIGDTFYINHQGTRYTYSITKKEIIDPTEISKVTADPSKPSAILITCEPPGTALKRLLVFADQISPDPAKSSQSPKTDTPKATNITGNSPTLIERLFGAR